MTENSRELRPLTKLALEMGPLIIFFFANARGKVLADTFPSLAGLGGPIFIATALFMVAMIISLTVSYMLTRSLPIMPLVSGAVVLTFGALTLFLQDDLFIKLKPTIVNVLFGGVLLIGLYFGKAFLKIVFESAFALNDKGWRILSLRWGLFFLFLAILNEVIWRNFTTDFWVAFKVWGVMPITMLFACLQMPLLNKYPADEPHEKA